jgi:hypothetical protein
VRGRTFILCPACYLFIIEKTRRGEAAMDDRLTVILGALCSIGAYGAAIVFASAVSV